MRSAWEVVSLRRGAWSLLLWLILSMPHVGRAEAPAAAQSRDEQARALFFAGLEHSKNERWDEAATKFRESLALVERPSTLQNLVAALQRLGRYGEAIAAIDRFLTIADAQGYARTRAEFAALRPTLEAQRGTLVLHVDPAQAEVQLNGRMLPASHGEYKVALDPGLYVVEGQAVGHAPYTRELRIEKGEAREYTITLPLLAVAKSELAEPRVEAAAPPFPQAAAANRELERPSRPSLRPWVWASAASGAVTLGLGVFTWLKADHYYGQALDDCPSRDDCNVAKSERQRLQRYIRSTWALMTVAGVSAITAATLLWLDLRTPHRDVSVGFAWQGASLRLRY